MGQAQSRTADFSSVLPSRASSKASKPATAATNSIQPQQEQLQAPAPPDADTSLLAVGQLDQLPAHCITGKVSNAKPASPPVPIASAPLTPRRVVDEDCGATSARPPCSLYVEPESVRKVRVLGEHAGVCSEILEDFLFVSSLRVARDRAMLDALGITHLVDCCAELSGVETTEDGEDASKRVHLRLALRDDTREDLAPFLLFQLVPFIAQCRQEQQQRLHAGGKGPKVLIHCHQGVSRSCAVAVAFVMADRAMPFREAAAFVKQRRAISSPNAAFLCQLIQWGRDLDAFLASESDPRVLSGLFRLAPHASHDRRTLVLKKCGDVNDCWAGESDATAELWPRGVFVFQRPSDATVVVWTSARCGFEDGALVARRLVENAARAKAFAVARAKTATGAIPALTVASGGDVHLRIVDVRGPERGDGDACSERFEYAAELQWYLDDLTSSRTQREPAIDAAQESALAERAEEGGQTSGDEAETVSEDAEIPLLFVLESLDDGEWERLKQYDAEDLTPQDAFLLVWSPPAPPSAAVPPVAALQRRLECFVWIGANCSLDTPRILTASRHRIATIFPSTAQGFGEANDAVDIAVERQNSESDCFWHAFELGY